MRDWSVAERSVGVIRGALDARADAANVEASQLRAEEAVGQADRITPQSGRFSASP